jgi:hypothetical protein
MSINVGSRLMIVEKSMTRRPVIALVLAIILIVVLSVFLLIPRQTTLVTSKSSTAISTNGIEIYAYTNATTISVGQKLTIGIGLVNDLAGPNDIATEDNWTISGFPVAFWPPCFLYLPVEFIVLQGNYSIASLSSINASSTAVADVAYECSLPASVEHVLFQPDSNEVTLLGKQSGLGGPASESD